MLVVEILEHQSDVQNADACSFFLKDLADANEAPLKEQHIHSGRIIDLIRDREGRERALTKFSLPEPLPDAVRLHACVARGSQKVAQGKGNEAAEWIDVEVCVLRLEHVETDLMISLSVPRRGSVGREGVAEAGDEEQSELFKEVLANFNICDWGLFG